jgi:hypothetical protein
MLASFTVFDAQLDSYDGKKGKVEQQQYTLQDASEGALLKQYIEFNQDLNAPKLAKGSKVEIEITEITQIFSGRPRIRGNVRNPQVKVPHVK